jgi:hypothetical protein
MTAGVSPPSVLAMTDSPSLRESIDELTARLARIGAAATTLRSLSPEIRHDIPPLALVRLIEDLEHDLTLASSQIDAVHERAVLELDSLRDRPRRGVMRQVRRRRRTMRSPVLPPPRG